MLAYLVRRLILVVPTLLGIMLVNFVIIQAAPGGPVQKVISELSGRGVGATARLIGGGGNEAGPPSGAQIGTGAGNQATVRGKLQRMQWRSLRKLDTLLGNRQTRFKRPQANGAIPAPGRGPLTIRGNSHQIYAMAMTAKRPQLGPIGHVPQAHGLIETT